MTRGRVLNGELYTQRLQKLIYLCLSTNTTMLATSKNVLFPGLNQLLTTGGDDPTIRLSPECQQR